MQFKLNTVVCAGLAACALAACGGGEAPDTAQSTANALQADAGESTARVATAAPAPVGTLALVSVLATGGLTPCAVSADGDIVAFADNSSGRDQVLVRNLRTGTLALGSSAANGSSLGNAVCRGMSPDGRFLVLDLEAISDNFLSGTTGRDAALFVKDLQTGSLQRVTPQLASLPTTRAFQFVGLSGDGRRVAFLGLPTTTYVAAYDLRANGPVRLLYRDLDTNQLVDLSSTARLEPSTGPVFGIAALAGDGSRLVFVTSAPFPEVGDNDSLRDVFVLNLNTGALALASPETPTTRDFSWSTLRGFAVGNSRLVYDGDSLQPTVAGGLYSNAVGGNDVRLLASRPVGNANLFGGAISETMGFDDALRQVVFLRYDGQTRFNQPWLRQLSTGVETRVDRSSAGVLGNSFSFGTLISSDGSQVAFSSYSSNLVRLQRSTPRNQVYSKTVAAASTAAQ